MRPIVVLVSLLLALSLQAATYTVSSPLDSGPGTLRQAILDANANFGTDQIVFTTPTVVATAGMPSITGPVDIDGSVGGGRVDIQGIADYVGAFNFVAGSEGSTLTRVQVRIYRYPLGVSGSITVTDSVIENQVSVNGNGNTLRDNTMAYVSMYATGTLLERNHIGLVTVSYLSSNNHIGTIGNGNTIGAGAVAMPVPDAMYDVAIDAAWDTYIEGNEILSNRQYGVFLGNSRPEGGAIVRGNTIHGQGTGIMVWGLGVPGWFYGARLESNTIYDTTLPIDLGLRAAGDSLGRSANDPAPDPDDGGNHVQNYPVLASAIGSPSGVTLTGTLTTAPSTTYRVEVFGNPNTTPQARTPLGTFDVVTDGSGNATFSQAFPLPAAPNNVALVATATNQSSNETSELSDPIVLDLSGQLSFSPTTYTVDEGDGTATITVIRTGGTTNAVTVTYATTDGTAVSPTDYAATSGTLTFGPGVTSQTITVPIVSDPIGEPAETFTVTLSNPTNGATIGSGTATVTIAAAPGVAGVPTLSTWALIALVAGLLAAAALRV